MDAQSKISTPRLVMHCDATASSGLGHLFRCLQLAETLRADEGIDVHFFGRFEAFALARIEQAGFAVMSGFASWGQPDVTVLRLREADLVIVDSYLAGQHYFDALTAAGVAWAAFDDFARLNLSAAQLVINFRVGAEQEYDYSCRQQALGPNYFPVADEFQRVRALRHAEVQHDVVNDVLVCLGGSDKHNVGPMLAECAAECFAEAQITLLSSEPLQYTDAARIRVLPLQADVLAYLQNTDVLISGGGRLKYEACYLGIPNATLSQTEDQLEDTRMMAQRGMTLDLGWGVHADAAQITAALTGLVQLSEREAIRLAQWREFPADGTQRLRQVVCASLHNSAS